MTGLDIRRRGKIMAHVDIAAVVLILVSVVLTVVLVVGMFIWAAVKDGQEDKAVQARLGIRRRTRLGR
jgi:cytochrome c biogenesis protein ResB